MLASYVQLDSNRDVVHGTVPLSRRRIFMYENQVTCRLRCTVNVVFSLVHMHLLTDAPLYAAYIVCIYLIHAPAILLKLNH